MATIVSCPGCGKRLKAPDHFVGKRVRCPACSGVVAIPVTAIVVAEPPEPSRPPARKSVSPAPPSPAVADDDFDWESPAPPANEEFAPLPKPRAPRRKPLPELPPEPAGRSTREYLYFAFAVALIPLSLSLFAEEDDVQERAARTLQELVNQRPELAGIEEADDDTVFALLPDGRIRGAHLSHFTWVHWLYALLSAGGFLALMTVMFRSDSVGPGTLVAVGLFTGTAGVLMLLAFQWIAGTALGMPVRGRGVLILIVLIVKFIGFSYSAATDADNGFWLSALGFTCGVGLCEEAVKALPIIWYLRSRDGGDWRGACLVGLASGVGFGVSEGIMYSGDMYNGISTGLIYVVRFVSCVALHATWSGAVGMMMYRNQDYIHGEIEWDSLAAGLLAYLGLGMVLHGLYDTTLKQEMNGWAMAIAVGSFAWLVWLIERSRLAFDPEPA